MARHLLLVALLGAVVPPTTPSGGGFDFPPERRQAMVARLHIHVADAPDAAGFARIRLTILVEGSATLEVESPQLGDATNAWQTQRTAAWRSVDATVQWEETFDMRQIKPGVVPIPSLKVHCRENNGAAWEEVEWTNILADVRSLPLPSVPPEPPYSWNGWLAVGALPAAMFVLCCMAFWRRSRRKSGPSLTHAERTLAELECLERALGQPDCDPREFYGSLSALLRRYVAERFALPATRQTTAEFLGAIQEATKVSDEQRQRLRAFLERCDLVKFAGVSPALEESRELVEFVRSYIGEIEQVMSATEKQEKVETQSTTHGLVE